MSIGGASKQTAMKERKRERETAAPSSKCQLQNMRAFESRKAEVLN
jgi:hypothetical protein